MVAMTQKAESLAVPTGSRTRRFLTDFLYDQSGGEFVTTYDLLPIKIDRDVYHLTLDKPEMARQEIAVIDYAMRQAGANINTESSQFKRGQYIAGLEVRDLLLPLRDALYTPLSFLLTARVPGQDEPPVQQFLRDAVLMERLMPRVSERIQKRFLERCKKMRPTETADSFRAAFLNSVSEVVMVSLGILHPGLFELRDAS